MDGSTNQQILDVIFLITETILAFDLNAYKRIFLPNKSKFHALKFRSRGGA